MNAKQPVANPCLEFEDYLALVAYIRDTESSNSLSPATMGDLAATTQGTSKPASGQDKAASSPIATFTQRCSEYRSSLERNLSQMYGPGVEMPYYPNHLYKPATWMAFGRTDHVGLVLLDDFDPVFEITAELDASIERISLAFCPRISSLGLEDKVTRHLRPIEQAIKSATEGRTPLVAICRMKLGVLATTAQGLATQRAVFRAIALRAQKTIELLKDHPASPELEINAEELEPDNLWYSLLNPQGFDEVGVVIGCKNYSVAGAIVAGFRSLTMAHVYAEGDESLATEFLKHGVESDRSPLFTRQSNEEATKWGANTPHYILELLKNHPDFRIDVADPLAKGLPRNHLFMSAYTTLGISHVVANRLDLALGCRGYSHVITQMQVHPGHEEVIESELRNLIPHETPRHFDNARDISVLEMGQNDFSFTLAEVEYNEGLKPRGIHTSTLIATTWKYLASLPTLARLQHGEHGLRSSTIVVTIPFPTLPFHQLPRLESTSTTTNTREIAKNYFRFHASIVEALKELCRRARGEFNVDQMADKMREAGLPRSLRFAVRYLYQDFFLHLSNPATLAGVLDLFDAFATFNYVLCEVVPDRSRSPEACDGRDLGSIKEVVDAIHNALSHRVTANHGFLESHDTAIDWRGGLNQLTEAADGPQKVAMRLVKFVAETEDTPRLNRDDWYERVASVTSVKLTPEATCSGPHFQSRSPQSPAGWHCLSHLEVNAGHVLHPLMYVTYIHEGAHLIPSINPDYRIELVKYIEDLRKRAESLGSRNLLLHCELILERHEEQFANSIVYLFVFDGAPELFLKYSIAKFFVHLPPHETRGGRTSGEAPKSNDPLPNARLKFIEYAVRLFLAVDFKDHERDWTAVTDYGARFAGESGKRYEEARTRTCQRFATMLKSHEQFFERDPSCKFVDEDFYSDAERRMREAFDECQTFSTAEWRRANSIYERYLCRDHGPQSAPSTGDASRRHGRGSTVAFPWSMAVVPCGDDGNQIDRAKLAEIRSQIRGVFRACLDSGEAMVANTLRHKLPELTGEEYRWFDELMTVCEILYCYIDLTHTDIRLDQELYVPRSGDGRTPQFTPPQSRYNARLLDPGLDGFFCVDPETRAKHLRWQIVVLKKLWDVSSTMRGRRLQRLATLQGSSNDSKASAETSPGR